MSFGSTTLKRGSSGDDVIELQLRLAGFRGTAWDGDFGPGTELQVMTFQRDYLGDSNPDGIVGNNTFTALDRFAEKYPIDFDKLKCACGKCDGFGNRLYLNQYREGKPQIEMYYQYEYPGIHKAILHAYRAVMFYSKRLGFPDPIITCGYRCHENNRQKGRQSTNHMGKAIDFDFPMQPGDDKRDDCNRCDTFRGRMVEFGNFQIGWSAANRKALEPSSIAPTWIHMDVRNYNRNYLNDDYFVMNEEKFDM